MIPNNGIKRAHRDRDEHDVVAKHPEEVLTDDRQGSPRELDRGHHTERIAADEREVPRLDRDVSAGADRDPHIGLRQRRRVVYAVADHRHRPVAGLEPLHDGRLVGGQCLGDDVVDGDTDLLGHGFRGGTGIAGHEPDLDPRGGQLANRRLGFDLDGVADREQPGRHAVHGDDRGRPARARRGLDRVGQRRHVDAAALEQPPIADDATMRLPVVELIVPCTLRPTDPRRSL